MLLLPPLAPCVTVQLRVVDLQAGRSAPVQRLPDAAPECDHDVDQPRRPRLVLRRLARCDLLHVSHAPPRRHEPCLLRRHGRRRHGHAQHLDDAHADVRALQVLGDNPGHPAVRHRDVHDDALGEPGPRGFRYTADMGSLQLRAIVPSFPPCILILHLASCSLSASNSLDWDSGVEGEHASAIEGGTGSSSSAIATKTYDQRVLTREERQFYYAMACASESRTVPCTSSRVLVTTRF